MRIAVLTALASVSLAACGQDATPSNNSASNGAVNSAEAAEPVPIPAAAPTTKEEALKIMHERHEGMEQIGKSTKTIKRVLESPSPDVATIQKAAATIADLAAKSPTWFPEGTGPDVGKTGAKPEIWQNIRTSSRRTAISSKPHKPSTPPPQAGISTRSRRASRTSASPARRATTSTARKCTTEPGRRHEAADLGPTDAAVPLDARRPHRASAGGRPNIITTTSTSGRASPSLRADLPLAVGTIRQFDGALREFRARPAGGARLSCAGSWRGIGHTPLGALSVVVLLLLVAVQVGLGLFASDEDGLMMGPLAKLVSRTRPMPRRTSTRHCSTCCSPSSRCTSPPSFSTSCAEEPAQADDHREG